MYLVILSHRQAGKWLPNSKKKKKKRKEKEGEKKMLQEEYFMASPQNKITVS